MGDGVNALFPPDERTTRRAPPASVEIEQALLGAILVDNRAWEKVSEFLRPEHFADEAHGRIFEACSTLIGASRQATLATLRRTFENDASLQDVGGAQYLAELAAVAYNIIDAEDYGRTILHFWKCRRVAEIAREAEDLAHNTAIDANIAQAIDAVQASLDEIQQGGSGGRDYLVPMPESVQRVMEAAENARQSKSFITGVATGYRDIDEMVGGMQGGELHIIAGRPGMGKTAIALGIARRIAQRGTPVAFFTMEMSPDQLNRRLIAERSSVPTSAIRRGRYGEGNINALVDASNEIAHLPIHFYHRPWIDPTQMRLAAARLIRRYGVGVAMVDHLGIMSAGPGRWSNRTHEVTAITGGLKAAAVSLDIPVIAFSQLSRAVEQRDEKRPTLSDLRDSGSIEQDADAVFFLYRHHYYIRHEKPHRKPKEAPEAFSERMLRWGEDMRASEHVGEFIGAKLRDGDPGTVTLRWDGPTTSYHDSEDQPEFGGEAPF